MYCFSRLISNQDLKGVIYESKGNKKGSKRINLPAPDTIILLPEPFLKAFFSLGITHIPPPEHLPGLKNETVVR